jgi:ubiquinone/menaquinone biosynthesis C-methylase UbiE
VAADRSTRGVVTQEMAEALTAEDGLAFCRFLRGLYFEELQSGHVSAAPPPPGSVFLDRARTLGLLRAKGAELKLTDIGYEVANVAKEYANWVDGGRALPAGVTPSLLDGQRVLDVGCSFGRHMLGFSLHGANVCGIDFQENYLRLSRTFAAQHRVPFFKISRARAEQLPFRSGCFDVVFCRLVLNYVSDIDGTITEFVRVLVPGGRLVLIVEPLEAPVRALFTSKWIGNTRAIAFILLGLLNTALVELGGRQIVLRRRGRMHAEHSPAWPTVRWLRRHLTAHGFVPLRGDELRDPHPELYVGQLVHRGQLEHP